MASNCLNCGSPTGETNRFCSNCGTALIATAEAGNTPTPIYKVQTWEAAKEPAPAQPTTSYAAELAEENRLSLNAPGSYARASGPSAPAEKRDTSLRPDRLGGIAPGLSSFKEEAAYTPYSTEAVRHLEQPGKGRSSLMPVVAVAAAGLLFLVGLSGYLFLSGSNTRSVQVQAPLPNTTPGANPSSSPSSEEEAVKEVVRRSNEEQIAAWRNLDTEILKGTRTGKVLSDNVQMVEELRRYGMYAVPENLQLDILDVTVTGDRAIVRTVEVWKVTFYKKSNNGKIESKGPDTLTETYYLVKENGRWLVNKLEIDSELPGTPSGD